jgi:hypothetical protein
MKGSATNDGDCVGCDVGMTAKYSSSSVLLLMEKLATTEGVFVGDDVGRMRKGLSSVSLALKEVVLLVGEIDGTDEYSSVADGSVLINSTSDTVVDAEPDDIGLKVGVLKSDFAWSSESDNCIVGPLDSAKIPCAINVAQMTKRTNGVMG